MCVNRPEVGKAWEGVWPVVQISLRPVQWAARLRSLWRPADGPVVPEQSTTCEDSGNYG